MRVVFLAFAVIGGVVGLVYAAGGVDPTPPPQQEKKNVRKIGDEPTLMQKKLAHAQKLLEGLAIQDFSKIESAADAMIELRKQAGWNVIKTADYEMYSVQFLRNLQEAKKGAKNKNLDAAALAYVDMTLTCVRCHQHIRDQALTKGPASGGAFGG